MPTKRGPYSKDLDIKVTRDTRVDDSGNFKEKPRSIADALDGATGVNDGLSGKFPRRKG